MNRPYKDLPENNSDRVYLELLDHVLTNGHSRPDRTGVGTVGVFGYQARYNLRDTFPLLTTKKVHFKSVATELLWMMQGRTDKKWLQDRGVSIWNEWTRPGISVEDNLTGDLGPVYGFQFRHFGANYFGPKDTMVQDLDGTPIKMVYRSWEGTDQLKNVVQQIQTNPTSRRHVVSAWNPCQIEDMALPPCHLMFMFHVQDNTLNTHFIMRSNDVCLGHPFNVASYALLTYIVANMCDLVPGELLFTGNDVHIYSNHIKAANIQLERMPKDPPKLNIKRKLSNFDDITIEDFELLGYDPHPAIKMEVSV